MKTLICILIIWLLVTIINYYFNYGLTATAVWTGILCLLVVAAIFPLLKLIKDTSVNQLQTILQQALCVISFLLTQQEQWKDSLIQKADWTLLKEKRTEIISQIKNEDLALTAYDVDSEKFKFPYNFLRVSTGANDIWIRRNHETQALTSVSFAVKRYTRGLPQWKWVYTEDTNTI